MIKQQIFEARTIFLIFILKASICASAFPHKVPAVFVFGDSIFDAGNNHYIPNCTAQADFPPYGSTFFKRPTGRFTNGRTVPDYLSHFLGIEIQKPFLEVQLQILNGSRKEYPSNGINFASAGSGFLQGTNHAMGVTPIQDQLKQFKTLVEEGKLDKKLVQQSIFFIESGSNDIFEYFLPLTNSTLSPDAYVKAMLTQVKLFIDQICKLGARRIAIFSLGPVGCVPARSILPGAPIDKCFGNMNEMAKNYNTGLENLVKDINNKGPGVTAVYGSVYSLVQLFRAFPARYGFKNVSFACCGGGILGGMVQCGKAGYKMCTNPDEFLFWDYFHPSDHTYKLVSASLWDGPPTTIRPINLKALAHLNFS